MVAYKQLPGMEGAAYYYFGMPKNPVNEWLVANHYSKFKSPPDFFTAGGMAAGIALAAWPVIGWIWTAVASARRERPSPA